MRSATFLDTRIRPAITGLVWPWIILALALALTVMAWRLVSSETTSSARARFEYRISEISTALRARITVYEQVLRGTLGLLQASARIDRTQWQSYVRTLNVEQEYPGIQGIGYAKWIRPAELASFENQVRNEDFPSFSVVPAGPRPEYTAIIYLEPFDERNRQALGYDMWSEPTRRAAMQVSRDTGRPVMSGRVTLVQETGTAVQAGFLMYLPYYGPRDTPFSVAERREALRGFVYAPFRMGDFMRGVLDEPSQSIRLEVLDGHDTSTAELMYDNHPGAGRVPGAPTASTILDVNGRIWTLRFTSLPDFVSTRERLEPLAILLGGVVISFLLFGVGWFYERRKKSEMLSARLGRIVEDSQNEIYVIDPESLRVWQTNRGARANLNLSPTELRRLTILDIMPEISRERLLKAVAELKAGPEEQVRFETVHRRGDGTLYDVEVSLQMNRATDRAVLIAFAQDISERKHAQRQQRLLIDELNHRVKNTLATVQSLATQTLATSGPAEFAKALQGRLAALAGSHNLLTRTKWEGASLAEVAEEQLLPYGGSSRECLIIRGEPVMLKPPAALAFGLCFHELATNAAKYGALTGPNGCVTISWNVDHSAKPPILSVKWRESKGPEVQPPTRRGFGRTLIERGLAYELNGKVDLRFPRGGLECDIVVPLTPAVGELDTSAHKHARDATAVKADRPLHSRRRG